MQHILAKIIVYQFIYFGTSVNLSRLKALDEVNDAQDNLDYGLEFLGIFAMNVAWILGTYRRVIRSDDLSILFSLCVL